MKIVLATGIYPPDIGGPATYVHALSGELISKGIDVVVVTYAHRKHQSPNPNHQINPKSQIPSFDEAQDDTCNVIRVSKSIPILRWILYAMALRKHAKDAGIVYAFSSVSVGIPLILAHLKKPKKILRLGGDFFWERYTARGGMLSLQEWYESLHLSLRLSHYFMHWLLNQFDQVIFSTQFQQEIYEDFYQSIPPHSVIENPSPMVNVQQRNRTRSNIFRLLFMGRFVGFKNLFTLLDAVHDLPQVTLTLAGEGPLKKNLLAKIIRDDIGDRVSVVGSVYGDEKSKPLQEHDLLVIPSTTEISPNMALEARSFGLPVLLTEETGLSAQLRDGMIVRRLRTKDDIEMAVLEVQQNYETFARDAIRNPSMLSWKEVREEHMALFKKII